MVTYDNKITPSNTMVMSLAQQIWKIINIF